MARRKKNEEITEKPIKPIEDLDIDVELIQDFDEYSDEVNIHRAFVHGIPGLKPVAAHVLWAMYVNNRRHNKPYTKSAKCEGEALSFSPHGSPYGSMARLAQDFIYHIPYIDGHGSFGSVVGGPTYAASRYTEMRLSEFIEDVLFYNTKLLDMGMNYLEEEPEPILEKWVALLPLLFITNTSGMGYPISNTWSSGNLFEFKEQLLNYLKTGKVDCSKIYPDFPTGGIIINKSEMKQLYETGKGTIKLRGKTELIKGESEKDADLIKILSLPYQIYPENFMEDIKKYVTSGAQHSIVDVSNRCDKNGILIEIVCEHGTGEYTLEVLFRKTCLQTSISDEHKCVLPGKKPILVTFLDYMKYFVDSNIELVKKEAKYNLDEIIARLELVDGLLSALDIIDAIIKEIKSSKSMDDAKKTLMSKKIKGKTFTERQADYIVHTPLGRLANLEQVKLQDEKKELEKKKAFNEDLMSNYKSQEKYFLKRFNSLIDKYAWERKTELTDIEMQDLRVAVEKPTKLRTKKEFMIVLTDNNCLKRIEIAKFRTTDEDNKNIKVQGNQKVTLVSNKGNMYKVWSNQIDKCLPTAAGMNIADIRPEIGDEHIIAIYSEDVDLPYIYFVTKDGLGKMSKVKDTLKLSKQIGAVICGFKSDTDEIIAVKLLNEGQKIEIMTNARTETVIPGKPQGRGAAGKKIIYLKKDEEITEVHSI